MNSRQKESIRSDQNGSIELANIFAALERINHRLEKLETSSRFRGETPNSLHPSQERFEIAEAIADAVFGGVQKEKACTFEPNAKPCDHCSMCSSRGF